MLPMVGSGVPARGRGDGSLLDAMENAVAVIVVVEAVDVVTVVVEVNVVIVDFNFEDGSVADFGVVMVGILEDTFVLDEVDISSTSL